MSLRSKIVLILAIVVSVFSVADNMIQREMVGSSFRELEGREAQLLDPAQITDAALSGGNDQAGETIDIFCAVLGTFASNLAITLGAGSGVYIGGGIVPRLGNRFERSAFRKRFEDKGRFRKFLSSIPAYVIVAETPALRGLAALLEQGG